MQRKQAKIYDFGVEGRECGNSGLKEKVRIMFWVDGVSASNDQRLESSDGK